jgi:hypothetical protein
VSSGRHDSGGFACDEKGVRIGDNLGTPDEDQNGTNVLPPHNKTVPPPSEKLAHPKGKAGRPSTGKSVSLPSKEKTSPRNEEANAGPSVTQNQVQDEINSYQTRRRRSPWRPSKTGEPAQGGGR